MFSHLPPVHLNFRSSEGKVGDGRDAQAEFETEISAVRLNYGFCDWSDVVHLRHGCCSPPGGTRKRAQAGPARR